MKYVIVENRVAKLVSNVIEDYYGHFEVRYGNDPSHLYIGYYSDNYKDEDGDKRTAFMVDCYRKILWIEDESFYNYLISLFGANEEEDIKYILNLLKEYFEKNYNIIVDKVLTDI